MSGESQRPLTDPREGPKTPGQKASPLGSARFHVALVEPAIPQNTGNISRTCVATGTPLHIIGKPVFSLDDRHLRRAGLDYWPHLDLRIHPDWETFVKSMKASRLFIFTCHGTIPYTSPAYKNDDVLVFGSESRGLPPEILNYPEVIKIVIPQTPFVRCLNLSNSVAIGIYEAIRQAGIRNC